MWVINWIYKCCKQVMSFKTQNWKKKRLRVKTELQQEHTHVGLSQKQLRKSKFGEMNELNVMARLGTDENLVAEAEDNEDETNADVDPTSPGDTTSSPAKFTHLVNGLIEAAKGDDEDPDDEMAASPFVPNCRLICYFGQQELIPLKLFYFQKPGW